MAGVGAIVFTDLPTEKVIDAKAIESLLAKSLGTGRRLFRARTAGIGDSRIQHRR